MALNYEQYLSNPYVRAFLDTIAFAEGGTYNKLYGGGTFSDLSKHPNKKITAGGYTSTAAGRYQFLYSTWKGIANLLRLPDFSPRSQDLAAIRLIDERRQLQKLANGDFIGTLKGLGCAWAALPYSNCGQKEKSLSVIQNYYNNALKVYSKGALVTKTNLTSSMIQELNHIKGLDKKTEKGFFENLSKDEKYILGAAAIALVIVVTR